MSYSKFSTGKADYVMLLYDHRYPYGNLRIFDGIDALVFENGRGKIEDLLRNDIMFLGGQQLSNSFLIKYCEEHKIPIYFIDPETSDVGKFRESLTGILEFPFWDGLLDRSHLKKQDNGLFFKLWSAWSYLIQGVETECRNAIGSEMIEEYVVERVRQETQKEKPRIGLVYGVAHYGIKDDLESRTRRNFTLKNHKYANIGQYSGLRKHSLNRARVARFEKGRWNITEYHPQVI